MTIRRTVQSAQDGRRKAPAAPAFAARHRAFVARFDRGTSVAAVRPVERITRRGRSHVIERMRMLARFCMGIVERRVAPGIVTRAPRLEEATSSMREIRRDSRHTILARVTERHTHSTERSRVQLLERRLGTVLRAVATEQGRVRIAVPRVETRRAFPPVVRTPARVAAEPNPAADRGDRAPRPLARARQQPAVPRLGDGMGMREPLALPHSELARVTDHVIRQLDRRALSYRERMGLV
jgi:hypothetical protein